MSRAFPLPPTVFLALNVAILKIQRLHHLPNETVGQDHCRIAILVGKIECQHRKVSHLLHRCGGQHDVAIVTMPAALHHGEIVALFRCDIAQSRSAAHHVHDHAGKLRACEIGHALLHQAEAGTRRST